MDRRTAAFGFLIVCLLLATLLLIEVITPMVAGAVFAVALVVLGGASGGFRKRGPPA